MNDCSNIKPFIVSAVANPDLAVKAEAPAVAAVGPKYEGISRILVAGYKHGMTTESIIASNAMLLEIHKSEEIDKTVCWTNFPTDPVKVDSMVLRQCPDAECAKNGGTLISPSKFSDNYRCNRRPSDCKGTYTKEEIDTAKCPVCGEVLWRKATPAYSTEAPMEFVYVCIVSDTIYTHDGNGAVEES